jgi:beta-lactamase superfamily II metal-dependent hydrolase
MFEIDFLPVDCETTAGSMKSGDAITIHFTDSVDGQLKVVVIDAGFQATGERMVKHILQHYNTNRVNLMISTHPDGDHLNGLRPVIEQLQVDELMIHQPRQHAGRRVSEFRNLESIDNLILAARARNTRISDPFTGADRFNGQLVVLGPEKDFYEQLVEEHLDAMTVSESKSLSFSTLRSRARNLFDNALGMLPPVETLTNLGDTDPRNETSVVALLQIDGQRLLFTGDAGLRALGAAADQYERLVGAFQQHPLHFFQAPHHGSRHNLGPAILDRILGSPQAPHGELISLIAAAAAAPKHPSPKVINALQRRGATVVATLGTSVRWGNDAPARLGWGPATPLPPLDESGEIDD